MKVDRIARVTFSIIFLALLILPILTYLFPYFGAFQNGDMQSLDQSAYLEHTFDSHVFEHYGSWDPIYDAIYNIEIYFTDGNSSVFCVQYLSYVVSVTFMWVVVNVLTFIPLWCVKMMKGWLNR